jgi:hypothetical protein
MRNFIVGTVFGIVVATVGFTGIAHILDKAVDVTKEQAAKAATKE